MSNRRRLPNRRISIIRNFEHLGLKYVASASFFIDGRLGEVWVQNGKIDSQADANVRDASILASLCLQHGASLDEIRKSLMRDSHGNASSPIAHALDLLAREIK